MTPDERDHDTETPPPPPDGSPDLGPHVIGAVEILLLDNAQLAVRCKGIADGNIVIQLGALDVAWEITSAKLKPAPPPKESLLVGANRAGRRALGALGIGRGPGRG